MRMLDLFAGLGGASQAMRDRGWDVVTIDVEPQFGCTITADLGAWEPPAEWAGGFDLIWASPPCQEFSRWGMPWCRKLNPPEPSLGLVLSAKRIDDTLCPRWWVVENVKGASRFIRPILGEPQLVGQAMLWGFFPPIGRLRVKPHKERLSSSQRAKRSLIPYKISRALAIACEEPSLF